jgi:uncharacterized repeat protein (TIGR02543 family)
LFVSQDKGEGPRSLGGSVAEQPDGTLPAPPPAASLPAVSFRLRGTGNPGFTTRRDVQIDADDAPGVAGWLATERPGTPAADDLGWLVARPTVLLLSEGDGPKQVLLWVRDAAGRIGPEPASAALFLDTQAPRDPATAGSTSHTPGVGSTNNRVSVTWSPGTDPEPGSGLDGYAVSWSWDEPDTPPGDRELDAGTTTLASDALAPGSWFFNLSTFDRAGNRTNTVSLGPFVILREPLRFRLTVNGQWPAGAQASIDASGGAVTLDPTPDEGGKYIDGTQVTLRAAPKAGHVFQGWSGACSGSAEECAVTMDRDLAVTAAFAPTFALSVDCTGSGEVSPQDCGSRLEHLVGTEVTLVATAAPGFRFDGWSGGCQGTGVCALVLDQHRTVTATFVRTFTLAVTCNGPGTVAPQLCGSSQGYRAGTEVTLAATPSAGAISRGWSGACSGSGLCTVRLDRDLTVTAIFAQTFTLRVTCSGSGSVRPQPCGSEQRYAAGDLVTLTATPAPGYLFQGWSGACAGSNPICPLVVQGDAGVVASFAPDSQPPPPYEPPPAPPAH